MEGQRAWASTMNGMGEMGHMWGQAEHAAKEKDPRGSEGPHTIMRHSTRNVPRCPLQATSTSAGGPPLSGLTAGSAQQEWSSTVDALSLQGGFRPPNPELSTLAITTGSRLMLEVHASLQAYIVKKLASPATAHLR